MNAIVWGSLLFPIVSGVVTLTYFKHRMAWWELLIPFAVTPILIFGLSKAFGWIQCADTEYWTGAVVSAEYLEPWTEMYTETYTETDSNGNVRTKTRTVIKHHSAEWHVTDNNRCCQSISRDEFENLCRHFGERKFESRFHLHQISIGDGNAYTTHWNSDDAKLIPLTTSHSYQNKVSASNAIRSYPPVKDKTNLVEYPKHVGLGSPSILGDSSGMEAANDRLSFWNAKLGPAKQCRMWLIVYRNKPLDAALTQEAYWKGGNKNELVVCVGLNDANDVEWAHSFSWSKSEEVMVRLKQKAIASGKFDGAAFVETMAHEAEANWIRQDFSEYDYIEVPLPGWCVLIVYLISAAVNVGIGVWAVNNDINE